VVIVAAVTTPLAAVAANRSRLENMGYHSFMPERNWNDQQVLASFSRAIKFRFRTAHLRAHCHSAIVAFSASGRQTDSSAEIACGCKSPSFGGGLAGVAGDRLILLFSE
jgi:hypothetical protein